MCRVFLVQKLLDCAEIIGLIQYFNYDLFSSVPKEFTFKKSLVICQHYGRHSVFLVLSKDRFTSDEGNIHLTHILQLFHTLYGTLNHIQSTHPDINQIHMYLKQTLKPITEYVFYGNRSIQTLFATVDYAPLQKNNTRCLLNMKHLLQHVQSKYAIKDGLFAYENRILYSTLDSDKTFYLQVILNLEQNLPVDTIYVSLGAKIKLKNGVSLIRIHLHRPSSLQPISNAKNIKTEQDSNLQVSSKPIDIIMPLFFNENDTSSINFHSNSMDYSESFNIENRYDTIIPDDSTGLSQQITIYDTDRLDHISSVKNNEINLDVSFTHENISESVKQLPNDKSSIAFSSKLNDESITDDKKRKFLLERSSSVTTTTMGLGKSQNSDRDLSLSNDSIDKVTFIPIEKDDCETDCSTEDIICLPPKSSSFSKFPRTRQRTLTNHLNCTHIENSDSDQHERYVKWGDVAEKNDEAERDELILYVQRNSRMTFAGIIEHQSLSEEYLQKLWYLMVTEMADMDRDIQIIPAAGVINKNNTDVKFHFNDVTRQAQFERILDSNRHYYKIPSADHSCMGFNAHTKLNQNSERKMIALSKGNNLISVNRNLPDRMTYFCRRLQEPQ
ncbi:unnamed protein product [Rotaria socialis]|uniref:Uncharacterized protein n=1 Tax=Rotaria socialis TaxID=392032 RepID=A0A818C7L6_9BILA|nr:unnamed protein product [Rotaria socialis]CAF3428870.1 unnamed protein product [Rotaria socialis]CAF4138660.1 unnamed protein product [Rotaria socialis]CAF4294094.1 unnamed protein product [Rotaria socialis]CAF4410512.1 unnamed protein product [Rotaria socialis]